jgi:chromosome partitioning protein
MRKIAVALSKGGVGKTTTAVNLAAGLAGVGRRVLLIDLDTQDQVAKTLGVRPTAGIAELVAGEQSADEILFPTRENLTLLAGGASLAGLKRLIARQDFGGERTLSEALGQFDGRFDYVVIDTAPGWDALAINALFYADEILTPVALEVLALQGLLEFTRSVQTIQQYHENLRLRYVLPTFMDRRVKKSDEILQQLENYFGESVCAPIRYNVRLSEAPGYGQTIFEFARRSPGAADYLALTERIVEDE